MTPMGRASPMAARDQSNAQWQVDVAVSYAKLGGMEQLDKTECLVYLQRGLDILMALKTSGRLLPNQDWSAWFNDKLAALDADE